MPIFIIAAIACMYGLRELSPLISGQENPLLSVSLVIVQIILITGVTVVLKRSALSSLARPRPGQKHFAAPYKRLGLLLHLMLLMFFAMDIYVAGWAELASAWTGTIPVLADELLTLAPLLFGWLIVHTLLYDLDRVVRLRTLADSETGQIWSRKRYLLFHFQAGLLPALIPLCLLMGLIDSVELIEGYLPVGVWGTIELGAILIVGIGATLLCTPVLIRLSWGCAAMRDGPLRQRLDDLCESTGLSYRQILIWRTGRMITNAAVMGFYGPLRYILVTDALLEQMSEDEIAAVFAHEVGHITGRHLPYYGLFIVGINLIIYDILTLLNSQLGLFDDGPGIAILQVVLLGLAFLGPFGWLSRRFERDADVRAVEHTGCPDGFCQPGCPLHDLRLAEEGPKPASNPRDRLCPLATRCFTRALLRIAAINGIAKEGRSWRHSSIASRVDLLYRLSCEPGQLRRFKRLIRLIKVGIWNSAVAGATVAILLNVRAG